MIIPSVFYKIFGKCTGNIKLLAFVPLTIPVFLFIPNFLLKVGLTSLLTIYFLSRVTIVKKRYIWFFLLTVYFFAYVFSPYWVALSSPLYKITCLFFLMIFGLFWSYFASADLSVTKVIKQPFWLFILAISIYLINFRPLNADIAWRGDEDFHITLTMDLFSNLTQGRGFSIDQVLRYPYLSKWVSLLFVAPSLYTDVKLYRIIPFLSVLFIAFFLFHKFEERLKSPILSLLFSLSFVSVPLVYFYTSLLYLEMPIVLFMTICIFDIKAILSSHPDRLITRPSWYFLLLISFLKETATIFLLLIAVIRLIYQVKINIKSSKIIKILLSETALYFLLLSPSVIYLIFRRYFFFFRTYGGKADMLFDFNNYLIVLKALFDQLGGLMVSAFLGFYLLFREKDKNIPVVLFAVLIGIVCFFVMDGVVYGGVYLGNSRWNLFVLPVIIYASYCAITLVNRFFQLTAFILILITNIILCPILADGTRLPNWGSPRVDTAEYTYPYQQAIKFLGSDRSTSRLLLFGQNYPYYGLRFYLEKYDFHPEIALYEIGYTAFFGKEAELSVFNNFFRDYAQGKLNDKAMRADTVLYHSMNNLILNQNNIYGGKYKITAKISNSLHSLYIFKRI